MKTHSLFNNGVWRLNGCRLDNGRLALCVESLKSGFCDWPIRYADGRVAWDYPERVPQYIKRVAASILNPAKRKDKWARLSDLEGVI